MNLSCICESKKLGAKNAGHRQAYWVKRKNGLAALEVVKIQDLTLAFSPFPWNRWSVSAGIRGQFGPEYAFGPHDASKTTFSASISCIVSSYLSAKAVIGNDSNTNIADKQTKIKFFTPQPPLIPSKFALSVTKT